MTTDETGESQRCRDAGIDEYVHKPINADILSDVLSRHIPEVTIGVAALPFDDLHEVETTTTFAAAEQAPSAINKPKTENMASSVPSMPPMPTPAAKPKAMPASVPQQKAPTTIEPQATAPTPLPPIPSPTQTTPTVKAEAPTAPSIQTPKEFERLRNMTYGDAAFGWEMSKTFMANTRECLDILSGGIRGSDANIIATNSKTIKDSAANIGAHGLHKRAESLEKNRPGGPAGSG
ncbi:MAG: hypothetical protein R3C68_10285 [Myxococcota bacterium]